MEEFTEAGPGRIRKVVKGESGAKRVTYVASEAAIASPELARTGKRRVGRPRLTDGAPHAYSVSAGYMRAMLAGFIACRDQPRAASTLATIADAITWLEGRLGPAVDEGYVPDNRRQVTKYVVRQLDGTERLHNTLAEAAEDYGITYASLNVALSRGNGKCGRFGVHAGNPARKECHRTYVVE